MAVDVEVSCFTSTAETVGLLGTGAQDVHLHFHSALSLYVIYPSFVRSSDEFRPFKVNKKQQHIFRWVYHTHKTAFFQNVCITSVTCPKREENILRKNACIKSIIRTQKRASLGRRIFWVYYSYPRKECILQKK